jgi:cytoskeletal protein RodZ
MRGLPLPTCYFSASHAWAVARSLALSYDDPVTRAKLAQPRQERSNTRSVGEFGDKFRTAREAKSLSLDDVSNFTKISSRMLQAIEEEHFDQLPGGVFNKGFIRAYARQLGLDDTEAVNEYLVCLRQAQVDSHAGWDSPARSDMPEKRPLVSSPRTLPTKPAPTLQSVAPAEELPGLQLPRAEHVRPPRKDYSERSDSRSPWMLLAAALAIVLVFVLWRGYRGARPTSPPTAAAAPPVATVSDDAKPAETKPATTSPVSSASSASATVPAPAPTHASPKSLPADSPAPAAVPPAASAPEKAAANSAANVAISPHAQDSANKNSSSGLPASETKNTTTNAGITKTIVEDRPSDDSTRVAPPPAASRKASAALLNLVIRASETSWISVTADGQSVSQERLIAPAHTSVRANREIVVHIGNAAGVSFLWNGAEIPADGAEGEVKTFVFDTQGMRVLPETQPAQP